MFAKHHLQKLLLKRKKTTEQQTDLSQMEKARANSSEDNEFCARFLQQPINESYSQLFAGHQFLQ